MKKFLLSTLVALPALMFAQTTILSDNFDSYTAGSSAAVASAGVWQTWSGATGGAEDSKISDSLSSSASNSMRVINGGPSVYLNDMILAFPSTYTTGAYDFKFKIYVPQGKGGYFNLGGNWVTNGAGYQYGGDFYFNADGSGFVDSVGVMPFTYNIAAWNDVKVTVNLTAGTKRLFINGTSVGTKAWHAAAGFGVVDIFGVAYANATGTPQVTADFFVDDVELIQLSTAAINENNLDAEFSIYPSPNNGQFKMDLKGAQSSNYSVTVTDLSGNIVHSREIEVAGSATLNFDLDLAGGLYFVNLSNGKNIVTKKITVK